VRELKHAIDRMAALYSEGSVEAALPSCLRYQEASAGLHQLSDVVTAQLPEEILPPRSPVISIPEARGRPSSMRWRRPAAGPGRPPAHSASAAPHFTVR